MLSELVAISNRYGANPDLVLAGGGNTSFKNAETLYIKGSGTTLATITKDGFVKMDRASLAAMFENNYPKNTDEREAAVLTDLMAARLAGEEHKRPSVETLLHDLFDFSYVVHTHPALVNGLTCAKNGEAEAVRLFSGRALWIELTPPGYILSLTVREKMQAFKAETGRDADIILLQNHGIFVAGNTANEIDEKYRFIMDMLNAQLSETPDFSNVEFDRERAALLAPAVRMITGGEVVKFNTNVQTVKMLADEAAFAPLASVYTPDHMVYYKRAPLYVPYAEDMEQQYALIRDGAAAFVKKYGFVPQIVAVQGLGYYSAGASRKSAGINEALFIDTMKIAVYTNAFGGPLFMADALIDFIANWEVESYRKKVSAAGMSARRAEGKISIVTGSAQGFGLGLAQELAAQGSYVVLADLNFELAAEGAADLCKKYGEGAAFALAVNVGDEESVKNMMYDTALEYGGMDVFVNNAGVLRAGSLEEMDIPSFEFVTKINYTAYFLCAKYASRIMKIQHQFAPDYTMDIIQINSKSGLMGSNKNFAYAGGKFGGIGLTQSFAMELVEYNIKVNAICPGNLMSGPLWTDPEKGLFVQYLRAGKVPGAKTIEDVQKFYEAKVPMNRGCEIVDVARALFYVIEQQYETGQAIPVTGGQNMLK